jgi:tetratricopeptide (TPR) repeat protein
MKLINSTSMQTEYQHKKEVSKLLNNYFSNDKLDSAKKLIKKELKNYPNDHFLLTSLGNVHYELFEYTKAIEYTQEAIEIAPNCPLTINNHAVVLFMHEKYEQAIDLWLKILEKKLHSKECTEGKKITKSLLNDTRVRLADAYKEKGNNEKALFYYKAHLENRKKGVFSNFTKKEIIREVDNLILPKKIV